VTGSMQRPLTLMPCMHARLLAAFNRVLVCLQQWQWQPMPKVCVCVCPLAAFDPARVVRSLEQRRAELLDGYDLRHELRDLLQVGGAAAWCCGRAALGCRWVVPRPDVAAVPLLRPCCAWL